MREPRSERLVVLYEESLGPCFGEGSGATWGSSPGKNMDENGDETMVEMVGIQLL